MTKFEIVAQAAGLRDALRLLMAKAKQFGVDVAVRELSRESVDSAMSLVGEEIDWGSTIEGFDFWADLHRQLELKEQSLNDQSARGEVQP